MPCLALGLLDSVYPPPDTAKQTGRARCRAHLTDLFKGSAAIATLCRLLQIHVARERGQHLPFAARHRPGARKAAGAGRLREPARCAFTVDAIGTDEDLSAFTAKRSAGDVGSKAGVRAVVDAAVVEEELAGVAPPEDVN